MHGSTNLKVGVHGNCKSKTGLKFEIVSSRFKQGQLIWILEEQGVKPTYLVSRAPIPGIKPMTVRRDGSVGLNVRRHDVAHMERTDAVFEVVSQDAIRILNVAVKEMADAPWY